MSEFGSDTNDTNEGFDDIDDTEEGSDASESFDWGDRDMRSSTALHETGHSLEGSDVGCSPSRDLGGSKDTTDLGGHQTNREGFAMDSGSDFAISQILDTPETIEQKQLDSRVEAQKGLLETHKQSCEVIIGKYGDQLDSETRNRVENGTRVHAVKDLGPNVTGSHMMDYSSPYPTVEVAMGNEVQMRTTDMHETMHDSSYNIQRIDYDKETGEVRIDTQVGTHKFTQVFDAEGELKSQTDFGRALTEAITHNRTLECLSESDAQYANDRSGYRDAADMAKELEGIIGKDAIDGSYFQGKDTMREAMEALVPGSYERFSGNLEKLTYSRSPSDRTLASVDTRSLLREMQEAKAETKGRTTA